EETSVFYGGTIKVKATIPAVEEQSHFKWVQQAWMQNVSITDDGRTLYAEYKIADMQKSAPGVQNLNFEMKAEGYVTKEGEQAPKPTFEIYMEGNKEENKESTKEKVVVTDEEELYITGRPAFDLTLIKGSINYPGEYNGKIGYYINYGIGIELKQDIAEIGDLRGLEYPCGEASAEVKLKYYYRNLSTGSDSWNIVEENDIKAFGKANGIDLVGYDVNYNDNDAYWPTKTIRISDLPSNKASGWEQYTITDSGNMLASIKDDIISIKFDDFNIDGYFQSLDNGITINNAYFVVGQLEIFAPNYDNNSDTAYEYQVNASFQGAELNTRTKGEIDIAYQDGTLQDKDQNNNSISWINRKGINGSAKYEPAIYFLSQSWIGTLDGFCISGRDTICRSSLIVDGCLNGGAERLIVWRSDVLEIEKYSATNDIYIQLENDQRNPGFPIFSRENIEFKYGVYKKNIVSGITTDELVEKADMDDFEWYDTLEEAKENGRITAFYFDDPDYLGYKIYRQFDLRFKVTSDQEYLYNNYPVRQKIIGYSDKERSIKEQISYTPNYIKTTYNNGSLQIYGSNTSLGTDLLILPYHATVLISVDDWGNNNRPQTTYDVNERMINFNITPKLSTEKEATDEDTYVDKVQIVDYLPKGLTYVEGSSNKEPVSVTLNEETGITEIVWEYENWQINHEAPEYPKITFQAEMSYTLKNNEKLTNKVVISTANDWSYESARTGSYGITIVNLAGLGVEKSTDTPVVEINSDIRFETEVVSGSDKDLTNIRMLDILPYNGDENGTHFTGEYTLKEVNIPDDITGYYTTLPLDKLETDGGLTRDQNGKLSAVGVDLENNDNWTKIEEGKVAEDTTAFIFVKEVLTSGESSKIGYTILPRGNQAGDEYGSSANVTVDSFTGVIKSNIQIDKVIERKISGRVFEDKNQNGIKEETEELLSGIKVRLLDKQGNEAIDVEGSKVESVTTDENGYYEFSSLPKGEYIVEFLVDGTKYEATKKLVGEDETINSNINAVKNNSARTDILTKLNTEEKLELIEEENINAGLITYVDIEAIKKWEDNANEPQKRPDSINLILYADGIENERVEVNEESNWRTVFKKKLKYDSNGKEIIYTIDEDYSNKFYEKTIDKNEVTNTFKVPDEKVEIEVLKIWEDEENKANKRPESIELIVKAEGKEVARKTVTENDNWRYTFELPKYDRLGNEIEYTVDEEFESKFYVKEITENVITNRFVVPDDQIEIPVEKIWKDENDKVGKRPESIKIIVSAKGQKVTEYTLSEENHWKYTFKLAKYDELGDEIEYTIDEEITSIFYEKEINGNEITNTFKVPDEKVEMEVLKVWDDNDNEAGKRSNSVVLQIKADGVVVAEQEVTEADNWKYIFELPKYDELGNEIEYSVDEKETESEFYIKEIVGNTIINQFVVPDDRIELTVEKEWNDHNDKYGKRPESVVVQILVKGEVVTEYAINEKENWTHTFELPKYDKLGNEVEYSIVEKEVRDYESVIQENKIINTCTYEPPVETGDMNIWTYLVISVIAIIGTIVGMFIAKDHKFKK
ncbi:MAG: Cna B-type domain-containing protein, partial [Clostridia bacterium]|nr:Cna B-type domain-containing protein [Clostridia bacterium]